MSSSTATPPSYSVVETKDGRLVNLRLKVRYPNRPQNGYHSLAQHNKRRANQRKPRELESEKSLPDRSFLGGLSSRDLEQELVVEEVVLCYPINENLLHEPVKLHLAYKDEQERVAMFPVTKMKEEWRLMADSSGASFDSLEKLLGYYRRYRCLDIPNRQMSLFSSGSPADSDITVFATTPPRM